MKTGIFVIFIFLFCNIFPSFSRPVTQEQALRIAESFFTKKNMKMYGGLEAYRSSKKTFGNTGVKDFSNYYIFNANKGYVIVSGSDKTPAVLGYSLKDSFDYALAPENLKSWLSYYDSQIEYLENNNLSSKSDENLREPILPLLTCKWGQGFPYNLKCPINKGQLCVTGCLATALSQVMYFYKWPDRTTQDIPGYTLNINGIETDIPSIPAGTKFDWENMLPTYFNVESTDKQQEAIATLMSVVGTSLNMFYNTGESTAYFSYYDYVPKTYFGYSENQKLVYRSDIEDWEDLIYNELAAGHPVVYGGQSAYGGHAFVIDGYDGDQMFHVDWGWETSEGYYLLDILNPGDIDNTDADYDNGGYSGSQCAIINLVPIGMESGFDYSHDDSMDLESNGINVYGTLKMGQIQDVVINICNKGAGYYSNLNMYASKDSTFGFDNSVYVASKGFTLKRRETRNAVFSWIPKETGLYYLFVLTGNNSVIDSIPVNVLPGINNVNSSGLQLRSIHMEGENLKSKTVDPNDENATLIDVYGDKQLTDISITNIGNERWDGTFRFVLSKYNQLTNDYEEYQVQTGSGWGTPGYTWNYSREFYNLEVGKYRLAVYANDILLDNSCHFNIYNGVKAWLGPKNKEFLKVENYKIVVPDDVLAVDLTDVQNVKEIIPNHNPNTLYFLHRDSITPESLADRNIIKGYVGYDLNADYIQLQDKFSYYSPYSYNARLISYRKDFISFSTIEEQNWSTLCLPFSANIVSSDGHVCKWHHDENDENGNFWLQKLNTVQNDSLYFICEESDTVSAWKPYIIAVPNELDNIVFQGENIYVHSSPLAMPRTNNYRFVSNMLNDEYYDFYSIDDETGRFFEYKYTSYRTPFSAIVLPLNDNERYEKLYIKGTKVSSITSSLNQIRANKEKQDVFYSISGMKLTHPQKGVNIVKSVDGTVRKIIFK